MADEEYLRPAQAFLGWFKGFPGTTFHDDIEIVDLRARGAGRGIVAKADIEPDTVLFTIPRNAILCSATSDLVKLIPSLAEGPDGDQRQSSPSSDEEDGQGEGQDQWTTMILIMIYEFLRGDKSPWKAYLDVLPTVFDTPMFWSADELKELQASPVVGRIGREEADEMIKTKVLPVIFENSAVFFGNVPAPPSEDELLQLAHRMGSTIMAYSFSLENDQDDEEAPTAENAQEEGGDTVMDDVDDHAERKHGQGCTHEGGHDDEDDCSDGSDGWVEDKDDKLPLGMVPMADLLNADAEFNAHISHGVDVLTATTVRPIKAGQEILNYYGPLSNGELLRRYGYTTKKHEFFDAVDLPWELIQRHLAEQLDLTSAEASKITRALDVDELEDPIMLDRDFVEDETTGELGPPASGRVLSELPPMLWRQARAFIHMALKRQQKKREKKRSGKESDPKGKDGGAKKPEKEIAASAISAALASRLAAYPTTLEQDVAQFEALAVQGSSPTSQRLSAALRVRIGEKRLLREALELAEAERSRLSKKSDRRSDTDGQPSGKRQKTN